MQTHEQTDDDASWRDADDRAEPDPEPQPDYPEPDCWECNDRGTVPALIAGRRRRRRCPVCDPPAALRALYYALGVLWLSLATSTLSRWWSTRRRAADHEELPI